jgi:hypothetical protein
MDGNTEYEIFESIEVDDCYMIGCQYLLETFDPYSTGDSWYKHYECEGGPDVCPLLADKVQEYAEREVLVDD